MISTIPNVFFFGLPDTLMSILQKGEEKCNSSSLHFAPRGVFFDCSLLLGRDKKERGISTEQYLCRKEKLKKCKRLTVSSGGDAGFNSARKEKKNVVQRFYAQKIFDNTW